MKFWAILPAAGIGRRMGSSTPKQYHSICGTPVLIHSINRLLEIPEIEHLVVVLHPKDQYWPAFNFSNERVSTVTGGEERVNSVINGLQSLSGQANNSDWILVHDAVRPCVTQSDIKNLMSQLKESKVGGLLGAPIDNTVKQLSDDNEIELTVDRSQLWSALTPQMFRFDLLKRSLSNAVSINLNVTDEASAIEAMGFKPIIVPGDKSNIKITHDSDLELARYYLSIGGKT